MRNPFRRALGPFAAALIAGLVAVELVVGAATHDPVAHAQHPSHTCAVCAWGHASVPDAPLPAAAVTPIVGRTAAPEAVYAAPALLLPTRHPARGPPAVRA